ncbi:MAG: hypothetical protein K8F91_06255, partial [Candidatus Obscuribacterales bacterium]|nr:hypothetical protein [Candidatus Obscuribacterales bacterium]
ILANISQKAYGKDFLKWIAVFGTDKRTVLITATCTADTKEAIALDLKDCLAKAHWSEATIKNPEDHLTYSVKPVEPFKLATGIQNALLFTVGGTFPQKSPDQPVFIAAEGLRPVGPEQQEAFAKSIVASTAKMKDFEQTSFAELEVDGLKGYESTSLATDTTNGGKMFVHQVILYTKDGYYRCQGIVSKKEQDKFASAFKKMARTLKRKI